MTLPTKAQVLDRFWSFNIGQVVTLGVFLVGLGVTWAKLEARLDQIDYRVNIMEHRVSEQQHASTTLATVVVELRLTREQLNDLRGDIRRLELTQSGAPRHRELTRPD
jgi:uncharacterized coiled-coil protein SlyX